MYKVKITKAVTFDDKTFYEGMDISFFYNGLKVLGNISVIMEETTEHQPYIIVTNIELYKDGAHVPTMLDKEDNRVYYLSRMSNVNYVYTD